MRAVDRQANGNDVKDLFKNTIEEYSSSQQREIFW